VDKLAHDEIRLTLPAAPPFAHIADAATTGLATRIGFRASEVDELRTAVSQAWAFVAGDDKLEAAVTLVLSVEPDGISVDVQADRAGKGKRGRRSRIDSALAAVVDEHEVSPDLARVHLRKMRHEPVDTP
jgi:hypothetical protein